jgi:site-specific recombinase XerD
LRKTNSQGAVMESSTHKKPIYLISPIFDSIHFIKKQYLAKKHNKKFALDDFKQAKAFLLSYDGNEATFNAYRREVERLLHWSWLIAKKSVKYLKGTDIKTYIQFCQKPPIKWMGIKKTPRFIEQTGKRIPNPEWRPFVATVSKAEFRKGKVPHFKKYTLSQKTLREIFTITGSFYNFLIQEEYTEINPVLQVKQKSRYFTKIQGKQKIRRLSELQWNYCIETAEIMAKENLDKHKKTLFIMTALYSMYLRISELAASTRWTPKMCDFYRDQDGLWWFNVIGKGNKQRQISVSDNMLKALQDYRKSLSLPPLPSHRDNSPLIPKTLGTGAITSTNHLRKIVQSCFDRTVDRLREDKFNDDADALLEATVHWLRHTGISDDVKRRPMEHVRDDAGHSSSSITDKYVDIELRERHATAKKKPIKQDEPN